MERPVIKIIPTLFDKRIELAGKIILGLMWALTIYVWMKSPPVIPIHFESSGRPDGYGSKATLFLLPCIATVLYIGLSAIGKYPHIMNYTVTITPENATRQYTNAAKMMRMLKLSLLAVFTLSVLMTYLTTMGIIRSLGSWFLPVVFVVMQLPVVISFIQSGKKG